MRVLLQKVLHGAGLRLMECVTLRIKDLDFGRRQLTVRRGKGARDRVTLLPASIEQQVRVRALDRERALARGAGRVVVPTALAREYPNAPRELSWQWVFPASRTYADRHTGAISARPPRAVLIGVVRRQMEIVVRVVTASIVSGKGAYELFVADVDYVPVPFCLRRFSQDGIQWERCFGPESDYRSVYGQKYGVLARADGGAVAVVTSSSRVAFELIDESSNSRTTVVETGKIEDLRSVALFFNETGQLEQFVPIDASGTLAVQVMLEGEEGSLYLGGSVSGESRALATHNPTQSTEMFVLKLERTGTIEGARVWGGAGVEQVDQIERLDDGALLVGGVFEGEVDQAASLRSDWLALDWVIGFPRNRRSEAADCATMSNVQKSTDALVVERAGCP